MKIINLMLINLMTIRASEDLTLKKNLINKYFYEENEIYTYIKPGSEENKIIKIKGEDIHNIIDDFLDKKISEENFQEEQKKLQQEIDEKEKQDMKANDNKIKKNIYSFKMISFILVFLFTIWNTINNLISNIENVFNIISINLIFDIISLVIISSLNLDVKQFSFKKKLFFTFLSSIAGFYMFINEIILLISISQNKDENGQPIEFGLLASSIYFVSCFIFQIIFFLIKY